MTTDAELRRRFFRYFWKHLRVVWPIMSGLVVFQLALSATLGDSLGLLTSAVGPVAEVVGF